jgi:hypothetical protein
MFVCLSWEMWAEALECRYDVWDRILWEYMSVMGSYGF